MSPTPKVNATVYLTLEELGQVDKAAEKLGKSRTAFMKKAVLEAASEINSG